MSWPEEMNSLVATKNFRERSNTGNQQVQSNELIFGINASPEVFFFVLYYILKLFVNFNPQSNSFVITSLKQFHM